MPTSSWPFMDVQTCGAGLLTLLTCYKSLDMQCVLTPPIAVRQHLVYQGSTLLKLLRATKSWSWRVEHIQRAGVSANQVHLANVELMDKMILLICCHHWLHAFDLAGLGIVVG